jgi:hypothetical protein
MFVLSAKEKKNSEMVSKLDEIITEIQFGLYEKVRMKVA